MYLIVVLPFAHWLRGEAIVAAEDIADALANHSEKVVRVGVDPAPAVSAAEPEHAPEA